MNIPRPLFWKATDAYSVGMTVAYSLTCPKLESAVVPKGMKRNQSLLQHRIIPPKPRLKSSIAESSGSRRFTSVEFDKASSGEEFGLNMEVKYNSHAESIPKVNLLIQSRRSLNHAIVCYRSLNSDPGAQFGFPL